MMKNEVNIPEEIISSFEKRLAFFFTVNVVKDMHPILYRISMMSFVHTGRIDGVNLFITPLIVIPGFTIMNPSIVPKNLSRTFRLSDPSILIQGLIIIFTLLLSSVELKGRGQQLLLCKFHLITNS